MTKSNKKISYFTLKDRFLFGFLLFVAGLLVASAGHAQCVSFAKAIAKPELAPFVHDGNYNATILGEGESIVLRKIVFEGQKYRIVVKGVSDLPDIKFRLVDKVEGNVFFDNASHEYSSTWDFDVQTTRSVSVEVTVLEDENLNSFTGGCVAVLFGLERD
jgi:hypothetical protein